MSTEDDSVFFRIAEDIFEAEELEQLPEFDPPVENPITDQYTTAPLCLGREHLLEAFHEVLDWSMADRQADEWPELTAKFADAIIPSLDIRAGEELRIDRPQVFMDLNGPGVVFDGDNVVGTFLGLTPGKLFFVDEQHGSEEEAVLAETGEIGLYVVLQNAYIEMADDQVPLRGNTLISLSNGTPDLLKLLRP